MSNSELLERIIAVYEALGTCHAPGTPFPPERVSECIAFLRSFQGRPLSLANHHPQTLAHLFRLLLDSIGLIRATKGDIGSFTLGDLCSIGTKDQIAVELRGMARAYADWMSTILFRGLMVDDASELQELHDLRYELPKHVKKCDFRVGRTLVECKRIHLGVADSHYIDIVGKLERKIREKATYSCAQFTATQQHYAEGRLPTLLVVDGSSYGDNTIEQHDNLQVIGLRKQTDIAGLQGMLSTAAEPWPDRLVFCWTNLHIFDGVPCALTYSTQEMGVGATDTDREGDTGWTVEFYPFGERLSPYRELRISSVVRSQSWITATGNWLLHNADCYSVGPVEHLRSPS